MSSLDTHSGRDSDDSATLQSRRVWKEAGRQELDVESQRLRDRLRAKMFGVEAAPIKIGRFTVIETVGSGGMGVVYSAHDQELDRRVAVKLLRSAPGEDASVGKGRMLREAQALAKLSHPNVVQVYEVGTHEVGTHEEGVFLAMELLTGPTLRTWLLDGPRSWREVLRHFLEAGQGLAAAHDQGIIHRDFKPANLLFGSDGRIRVVDFGLARTAVDRRLGRAPPVLSNSTESGDAFDVELTQTGEIMGTPAYMSPEQAKHEAVDARSDQYSYCVALYEALFGRRPHTGRSAAEVLVAVAEGEVRSPPRNTKVPARICRAIMRGLSVEPAQRFPSMEALLAELVLDDGGRRRWVGGGLVVLGGFAAALWLSVDRAPCPSFEGVLAEAWGEEQRSALVSGFAQRGPAAEEAATRTVARLDAYAVEWRAARVDTCEAHYVAREQSAELHDRRVGCLAERHAELQALVEAFLTAAPGARAGAPGARAGAPAAVTDADDHVIDRAPQAAAELTPIGECNDTEWLQRRHKDDPERRGLRVRLAQAQAQYKAGRYEQALVAIDEMVNDAYELGAPEVEAAGLLHRGLIHEHRRVYEPAVEALRLAINRAEEGGDDEVAARGWIHLVRSQALVGDSKGAKGSVGMAQSKAIRVGDPQLIYEAQESRAVEAWRAERFEQAIQDQQVVVDWRHEVFGDEHPATAYSELRFANILSDAGRHDEAQKRYARAKDVFSGLFGSKHPSLGRVAFEAGVDHLTADRPTLARKAFEEAERVYEASLGNQALELVDINKALTNLALERIDLEEAARRARRSVELSRLEGVSAIEVLDAFSLRAMVAAELKEHVQAIEHCRKYLEHLPTVPSSPAIEHQALFVQVSLIDELSAVGRNSEAEAEARRLLEQLERYPEGTFAELEPHAWFAIGRAQVARGALDTAAESYRRGLTSLESLELEQDTSLLALQARTRWEWGRLQAAGDGDALALVEQARKTLAKVDSKAPELAEIDAWLAASG